METRENISFSLYHLLNPWREKFNTILCRMFQTWAKLVIIDGVKIKVSPVLTVGFNPMMTMAKWITMFGAS